MSKYTLVDTSCCKMAHVFKFVTKDGVTYNLSGYAMMGQLEVPYINVSAVGGITKVLTSLNSGGHLETDLLSAIGLDKWMIGEFNSSKQSKDSSPLPIGSVRLLPVMSYRLTTLKTPLVARYEFIIDNSYNPFVEAALKGDQAAWNFQIAALNNRVQSGGSLYDNKGKLLYRGEMKNGVPHGYGTGYYANGKVGHTGMFKGGKIVQ
jgi:hypothetical protein